MHAAYFPTNPVFTGQYKIRGMQVDTDVKEGELLLALPREGIITQQDVRLRGKQQLQHLRARGVLSAEAMARVDFFEDEATGADGTSGRGGQQEESKGGMPLLAVYLLNITDHPVRREHAFPPWLLGIPADLNNQTLCCYVGDLLPWQVEQLQSGSMSTWTLNGHIEHILHEGKMEMIAMFHRARPLLAALGLSRVSLNRFAWAMAVVNSRAFDLPGLTGSALVPFADVFNHHSIAPSERKTFREKGAEKQTFGWGGLHDETYTERGSVSVSGTRSGGSQTFSVYADQDYARGDEVFIEYGSKSNLELVSSYGFVLPANIYESIGLGPWDVLRVADLAAGGDGRTPPTSETDSLWHLKRALLETLGLHDIQLSLGTLSFPRAHCRTYNHSMGLLAEGSTGLISALRILLLDQADLTALGVTSAHTPLPDLSPGEELPASILDYFTALPVVPITDENELRVQVMRNGGALNERNMYESASIWPPPSPPPESLRASLVSKTHMQSSLCATIFIHPPVDVTLLTQCTIITTIFTTRRRYSRPSTRDCGGFPPPWRKMPRFSTGHRPAVAGPISWLAAAEVVEVVEVGRFV